MKIRFLATTFALLLATSAAFAQQSGHEGHQGHEDHGAHADHSGHAPMTEEAKRRDQLRAAVQDICPVSGEKLGTMGEPLKVQAGEESVFLCCQGCVNQAIKKEHWATIHTNIAKAQGICPIMGKDLPSKPKFTVIEGQVVYVCCPPCTKKLAAEPQKYLREIDTLYAATLEKRQR